MHTFGTAVVIFLMGSGLVLVASLPSATTVDAAIASFSVECTEGTVRTAINESKNDQLQLTLTCQRKTK